MSQIDLPQKTFTVPSLKDPTATVLLDKIIREIYEQLQKLVEESNSQDTRLTNGGL